MDVSRLLVVASLCLTAVTLFPSANAESICAADGGPDTRSFCVGVNESDCSEFCVAVHTSQDPLDETVCTKTTVHDPWRCTSPRDVIQS